MANLEILALDTVVPQIRAPGVGDGYSAPRDITMALGTTFDAQAITAAGNVTLSGGTANQVQYLNAGKVLTGSSNLTFDGTTLTVNSLSLTGSGVFPAGTALLPSITTVGDLNTGIYFPAADTIGLTTAGVERLRVNAQGDIGIGVTPGGVYTLQTASSFTSGFKGAFFAGVNIGNSSTEYPSIGYNVRYTSTPASYLYTATDTANLIRFSNGQFQFFQAPSGPSGTAITFTQTMTLDAAGLLGIGTATPNARLTVQSSAGVMARFRTGSAVDGRVEFAYNVTDVGYIAVPSSTEFSIWARSGNTLVLGSNNTERLRLSTTGLLQFAGTTSAFPALKRVSAALNVRLADDSADAALSASELTASASTVNLSSIVSSGYSLTGSAAAALMDLSGTWNTTGTPTGIKLNLTDTASNTASLLMDLQTASTSRFSVRKDGLATAVAFASTSTTANESSIASTGYSLTGSSAVSLMDLAGTWNTTGVPSAIKLNITDTASNAASLLMDLQIGGTSQFSVAKTGTVTLVDAADLAVGTTTGTKIGTATSQKLGFWNAAPIAQPTTGVAAATIAATGAGDVVAASTTFDGYTIPQVVKALRDAGLLA